MKRITSIAFLALATVLSVGTAAAQQTAIRANIPFGFRVGGRPFPAGTYTITSTSSDLILVRNEKDVRLTALSLTIPSDDSSGDQAKLVFHHYGNQYFLSQILCPTYSMSWNLPVSSMERKVRQQEARGPQPTQVLLALK